MRELYYVLFWMCSKLGFTYYHAYIIYMKALEAQDHFRFARRLQRFEVRYVA